MKTHREFEREKNPGARTRSILPVAVALLIFLLAPQAAFPGEMPMRCSATALVQIGDDEGTVRAKCGEPYLISRANQVCQTIRGHLVFPPPITRWYYNKGVADYIYIIGFEGGQVTDISTGERGFPTPSP